MKLSTSELAFVALVTKNASTVESFDSLVIERDMKAFAEALERSTRTVYNIIASLIKENVLVAEGSTLRLTAEAAKSLGIVEVKAEEIPANETPVKEVKIKKDKTYKNAKVIGENLKSFNGVVVTKNPKMKGKLGYYTIGEKQFKNMGEVKAFLAS